MELYSLIEKGVHDLSEILALLKDTETFLIFFSEDNLKIN